MSVARAREKLQKKPCILRAERPQSFGDDLFGHLRPIRSKLALVNCDVSDRRSFARQFREVLSLVATVEPAAQLGGKIGDRQKAVGHPLGQAPQAQAFEFARNLRNDLPRGLRVPLEYFFEISSRGTAER